MQQKSLSKRQQLPPKQSLLPSGIKISFRGAATMDSVDSARSVHIVHIVQSGPAGSERNFAIIVCNAVGKVIVKHGQGEPFDVAR